MANDRPKLNMQLPIIDQHGKLVGYAVATPDEIMSVDGFTDERGEVWVPPTAFAYAAVCAANNRKDEALTRALDLLKPDDAAEVERLMRPPMNG